MCETWRAGQRVQVSIRSPFSIHTLSSHAYIVESFSHESTRAFTRLTAWKFARPAVDIIQLHP